MDYMRFPLLIGRWGYGVDKDRVASMTYLRWMIGISSKPREIRI